MVYRIKRQRAKSGPEYNPWLICISVMLVTTIEVLDTMVTNVAVPNIAGNLGVTTHDGTWVVTSYLVSNAIILPATAWLSGFFGRKRFLALLYLYLYCCLFNVWFFCNIFFLAVFIGDTGNRGRRFTTYFTGCPDGKFSKRKTWACHGCLHDGGHCYSRFCSYLGRMDYGQSFLALDILYQYTHRPSFTVFSHRYVEDPSYLRKSNSKAPN